MKIIRNSRALRAALLASASVGFAGSAMAQEVSAPDISQREYYAQGTDQRTAVDFAEPQTAASTAEPQIVVNNNYPGGVTGAIDPNNITGVGQMIVDNLDGFIGLCTGTLINPRTVIFAAHCVNTRAANAYGQNSGGQPIGFGFNVNNNAAGASAFGGYLNGVAGASGGAKWATNTARNMYDANYVAYNPLSLETAAAGFLYGDVAIASLDTPAAGIPTWALLFSPLNQPASIDKAGTGYHVTVEGYGNNGLGATGATGGIDYRRRVAENMLGALASLDDLDGFLYGVNDGLPQNLYWTDFDDPRRGTTAATRNDFNVFRDNALPKEGITASGDSGGPLVLDQTYAKQLVIGVLSGGSRFFSAQTNSSYGTASFYQPLYLYWDWVAANNPYHYVSSKAGDAKWSDATHWVTNLDPNYYVINGSAAVNGLPTATGGTNVDTSGKFGQICVQGPSNYGLGNFSDCYDLKTGVETYDPTGHPIGTGATDPAPAIVSGLTLENEKGSATVSSLELDSSGTETGDSQTAQGIQVSQAVVPAATLANGLPGATNFVPTNFDGNRLLSQAPRYFDVTLSAAGTTTLDTVAVVDNFTLNGLNAGLNIAVGGSLTSNMNVNQILGSMTVNGSLTSVGDYMLMLGGLNGTGTVTTPFFTNVAGTIAPATAGTVGTLTFKGNVVLSSGSTYMVDLTGTGTSDKLAVQATTFNGLTPTNGVANVGGRVAFTFTSSLRAGQGYTILTAEGGRTGTFQTPAAFTAILSPVLNYTPTAVQVAVIAASYSTVIDKNSPVQLGYARLLDQNRGNASQYDAIYGPLDLASQATIRSTLEGLAPTGETTIRGVGTAITDTASSMVRDRVQSLDIATAGGTVAHIGQPLRVASNAIIESSNLIAPSTLGGNEQTTVEEGALPENMSAFLAGGYVEGDSSPMPAAISTARNKFDGWYIAGGIETLIDSESAIGFALSYSRMTSGGPVALRAVRADLIQGTLYGKYQAASGLTLDSQISAGVLGTHSQRSVAFVGTNYTLRADEHALAFASEAGLGYEVDMTEASLTPRVAWRTSYIGYSRTAETGGPMALATNRLPVNSSQLRGGLTLAGKDAEIKPFVSGTYVYDFGDHPAAFTANFVGSTTPGALFQLASQDRSWTEIATGVTVKTGAVDLSIAGEMTIGRDDVKTRAIRGSFSFHF